MTWRGRGLPSQVVACPLARPVGLAECRLGPVATNGDPADGNAFRVVPVTLGAANRFVELHHRHHGPVLRALWSVGVEPADAPRDRDRSALVAVGIVSLPVSRMLNDGATVEVRRIAVPEAAAIPNLCSIIYGRLIRAAGALGWDRVVTYTSNGEDGASLRAAGFAPVAAVHNRGKPWSSTRSEPQRRRFREQIALPYAQGIAWIPGETRWEVHLDQRPLKAIRKRRPPPSARPT